jgi:tetratricopeptide (TPR) repeat protein
LGIDRFRLGLCLALLCSIAMVAPAWSDSGATQSPASLVAEQAGAGSADHRSTLEQVWSDSGPVIGVRAGKTRRRALELGVRNLEGAALALIAAGDGEEALSNRRLAVRLAPDLPAAHMALARSQWQSGDYRDSIGQVAIGIVAIPRNIEASVWLLGSLLVMFAVVLISASLVFVSALAVSNVSHAAHDLGDLLFKEMPGFARAALLATVILLPVVLGEGLLGLMVVLFAIAIAYGGPRHRMVLTLAAALLVIGLYPILQLAGTVLGAPAADPAATAAFAVVQGRESRAEVEMLVEAERGGDELAAKVLAIRARRMGRDDEAAARFERLLEVDGADPLVLTALGNIAFHDGRTDEAIAYYERAQAARESALLLFNLSQAYAKAFRMEEFEHTMSRAQRLGHSVVGELSRLGDTEFVADLPPPLQPLRDRMLASADGRALSRHLADIIAPGMLGRDWLHTAGGFMLVGLISLLVASRYQHASRCGRCGRRICARCDGNIWASDLCDGCHHLFHRPQGTDPALRMARLQELRGRESRIEKVCTAASLIIPGASGLLAKRPDLCLVGIVCFAWSVVLIVWRNGVVPDPMVIGVVGPISFVLAGTAMAIIYLLVMLSGMIIRRSQ